MKDLFSNKLITLNYKGKSKDDVIEKIAEMLNENGYLINK